ncbi:MAG: hypothetical protein ACREBW_04155 [Candidatus Micrarchaeaceae archaeon]
MDSALGDKVENLKKEAAHWEKRLIEVKSALDNERAQHRDWIADATAELQRIKMRITEYEEAMETIREADVVRDQDLEKREKALRARQRALYLEKQDFADEKKRFYQTKDLQA